MRLSLKTFKEVAASVIPIVVIVLLLNFTIAKLEAELLIRFGLGSVLIILGLGIFLWGAELAITEIGSLMGNAVAHQKPFGVFIMGFLLGFIITVAEPDLLILANQISKVLGGSLGSFTIVLVVSLGVGLLVGLGFLRILKGFSINLFFAIFYILLFASFIFVPEAYQAIAFDSSGATTGAMTTPFILALGLGVSRQKGSIEGEKDSFGLVGIASVGPVLAVVLMSFFVKIDMNIEAVEHIAQEGVIQPFIDNFFAISKESIIALLPLILIFAVSNYLYFKLDKRNLRKIRFGFIYTLLGLIIFLLGVHSGFIDLALVLGEKLASHPNRLLLPAVGFVVGIVVVMAEPAVYVLSNQVEEVTAGSIQRKVIMVALCIGVATAVALSMLRIMTPKLRLWMIIVPGFLIAIALSFKVKPLFVGIAYDSGGVASGPMTATFILGMAQGAAGVIPTADVMMDGFGVIAAVAMTPVLSIMILGLLYEMKTRKEVKSVS
ncbi:MAG: DUF1538 domain-containing protein [Tissierellia bacterium]|nr:DUF1538 domain-containing protein [Tissierellia bacterium]